ncbi:MAG: F0F1 ATP synthase subunit C [Firmicutes bacterium]|nr:F0F1 ATP synthase subunit C [Bacillota bacterium]
MSEGLIAIAIALAVALPGAFTALGQGRASAQAMDAIWRQPEATGSIRTTLIIALAFMEALTIYGLLIAFQLMGKL